MTQEPTREVPTWIRRVVVTLLALWMSSYLFPPVNLDVGCLLYAAKRWLAGDRLYIDVIDPNTPWSIALHVPAEFMARFVGLDGPTWFSAFVLSAIALSTGLVTLLTRRCPESFGPLVAPTLPLVTLFVLGVDAGRCFGQREHLLMIAAAPYLALAALRLQGRKIDGPLALGIAIIAGLGFTIKPHFLLPLTLVELLLVKRGWRKSLSDVVPWTILAVQGAHALFALLVTPAYIEVIIPFASEVYASPAQLGLRALQILFGPELAPVTVLLPILIVLSWVTRFTLGNVLVPFIFGAAGMAALQGKGWDYHSLPAVQATLFLSALLAAHLAERSLSSPALDRSGTLIVSTALLLPFLLLDALRLVPFRDQLRYADGPVDDWVDVMAGEPGNHRVLLLSAGMYPQFPAINYADFKIATPFMTLWPLHGLYEECAPGEKGYRPLDKLPEQEAYVIEEVVEGLTEEHPEIVVVDQADGVFDCSKKQIDYLPYFMRDPRFAREFTNYRPLKTLDHYVFYERVQKAAARGLARPTALARLATRSHK